MSAWVYAYGTFSRGTLITAFKQPWPIYRKDPTNFFLSFIRVSMLKERHALRGEYVQSMYMLNILVGKGVVASSP